MTLCSPVPDRSAYRLVLSTFAAFGFQCGAWQVLIADLALDLALTPGALGLALTVGALASIPVMFVGGRLADRLGTRAIIAAGAAAIALSLVGVAFTGAYMPLVALLLLYAGSSGFYDVGINAIAMEYEQVTRERVMAYFHAAFSGGAALGAIATGLVLASGVPFRGVYLGLAAAMVLLALRVRASAGLPAPATPGAGAAEAAGAKANLYAPGPVLLLAVMTCMSYFGESSLENWSALYLRDALQVATLVGASGVAVFHVAMWLGRLGVARILQVVGRRTWMIVAGAIGVGGTALAFGTTIPAVTIAGMLLLGLALAAVAPVAFSLAGEVAPGQAGRATAVITTIGYFGALVGPSIIGGVAELVGLRLALSLVGVGAGVIFVLAWRMRVEPPSPGGTSP